MTTTRRSFLGAKVGARVNYLEDERPDPFGQIPTGVAYYESP